MSKLLDQLDAATTAAHEGADLTDSAAKEIRELREAIQHIAENYIPDSCTCSRASDGSPEECQSCLGRRFVDEILDN